MVNLVYSSFNNTKWVFTKSTNLKYNIINKILSEEFKIRWIDLTEEAYQRKLKSLEEKGYKPYIIYRLEGVISRTKKYFKI